MNVSSLSVGKHTKVFKPDMKDFDAFDCCLLKCSSVSDLTNKRRRAQPTISLGEKTFVAILLSCYGLGLDRRFFQKKINTGAAKTGFSRTD